MSKLSEGTLECLWGSFVKYEVIKERLDLGAIVPTEKDGVGGRSGGRRMRSGVWGRM